MKKQFYLCFALLVSCFYLDTAAQNARTSQPVNPATRLAAANGTNNYQNNTSGHKNGNTILFPSALSGYYTEGFEGTFPPAGWQVIDVLDPTYTWAKKDTAYEGISSAYIHWTPMTGVLGDDWFIMPQFSCIATDSLSFFLMPEYVAFPPDTTFVLLSTTDSALTSFTTVLDMLIEGVNLPATVSWQNYSYDLSAYAGQDVWIAFRNVNDYGDGILIDKVSIGTKPALNAQAYSIDMPSMIGTATNSPLATVKNDGAASATFDVTMSITGGYTSTKTVTSLGSGATQQVTFDPWNPIAGTATISIVTALTGDALPADDSLATSINVLDEFVNYGWESRGTMLAPLFGTSPSSINTNDTSYLYSAGGSDNAGIIVANSYSFAPYSNAWSNIPNKTIASFEPGSFSWGGKIYVVGGYNPFFSAIGNVQIYDPVANGWTAGAPIPTPVGDFASGLYNDSLFYVIGGYDGAGDVDLVQIYNPNTNSWTSGSNIPFSAAAWRGGISGNKIVVTCGYSQTMGTVIQGTYVGTIDPTNPSLITWVIGPDYPTGPNARLGGVASLDAASGLVIFTGGDPDGAGLNVVDFTFGFDVNTNTWKIGPPKITPVSNLANMTCMVDNDSLYIVAIGGYLGAATADVNEWLNMGPYVLPTGIDEVNADFGFSIGPNPVSEIAHLSLNLKKSSEVNAVVNDVTGKIVAVICNKTFSAGRYNLDFNGRALANGVYMVTLTVNGSSNTYKLVKE